MVRAKPGMKIIKEYKESNEEVMYPVCVFKTTKSRKPPMAPRIVSTIILNKTNNQYSLLRARSLKLQ